MCEECLKKAAEIDPAFLKLMAEMEPEYRALEAKVKDRTRAIFKMDVLDEDGKVDVNELPEPIAKELLDNIDHLSGVMGMALLLGWHCVSNKTDPDEAMLTVGPMMGAFNRALNESLLYMSVRSEVKH